MIVVVIEVTLHVGVVVPAEVAREMMSGEWNWLGLYIGHLRYDRQNWVLLYHSHAYTRFQAL